MRKLFELTTKDFLTGVSEVAFGLQGLFFSAPGITPFVNAIRTSKDFGLLQTTSAPVDMTGAIVKDAVRDWAVEATGVGTGYLYGMGASGNFYVIDLSNNAITNERSGANVIPDFAKGLEIFEGDLFYTQQDQVGRCTEATPPFDTSSSWTNNWDTQLQDDFLYHPLHLFSARLWVGDKDAISSIISGPTFVPLVLQFQTDYRVMCLEDDGQFLVAGLTQNLGDPSIMAKTKIIFWDTYSEFVNREWELPEPNIIALKKKGSWLYAIAPGGVYRFTYSSSPEKILEGYNLVPSFGLHSAVDVLDGDMLAIGGVGKISTYGSPLPGYKPAVFSPFAGISTNTVHAIKATAKKGTIYFSTSNNKLYRQLTTTGGGTGKIATTNFIPLGEKTKIELIKLVLGTDLASGDTMNVNVNADPGDTAVSYGAVAFTTHGAVRRVTLPGTFEAEDLQLVFNYTLGNIKIRRVEVWGSPDPTALK